MVCIMGIDLGFDVDFDFAGLDGTMPIIMNMEGTMPIIMSMEGTRPLSGPALPNLINAVKMLKSKPMRF